MFSATKRRLLSEIAGHSHWINTIELSTANGLLMTIGDDTKMRVWQLDESEHPCVSRYSLITTT